jgi:ubiquinone/menaquinone biosynthesis C-methylase UbiE
VQIEAWDRVAKDTNFNLEIDTPGFIIHVPKEATILDFGCGYGRISEHLYLNGYSNVVGVDSSGEMIKRGIKECPHLSLKKTHGLVLDFSDGIFDAVVVCAVFTCLPEQQQKKDALTEIERVLRPGGVVHVVEFCSDSSKVFESKMGVVMHHQRPNELMKLLCVFSELSLTVTETQTMGGDNARVISYFGQKST